VASGCVRAFQPTLNQMSTSGPMQTSTSSDSQQSGQTGEYHLRAVFFENKEKHFSIRIAPNADVFKFMKLVKRDNPNETANVDAADLQIWKVDSYVPTMLHSTNQPMVSQLNESIGMSQRIEELPKRFSDLPKYCERMDEDINDYFKEPPLPKHIHIIVGIPRDIFDGEPKRTDYILAVPPGKEAYLLYHAPTHQSTTILLHDPLTSAAMFATSISGAIRIHIRNVTLADDS
jgi:hypothetical protein